jgi:hypothetical protein
MDIVDHVKRMRLHGFALGLLMNPRERMMAAIYGQKRDIRHLIERDEKRDGEFD